MDHIMNHEQTEIVEQLEDVEEITEQPETRQGER